MVETCAAKRELDGSGWHQSGLCAMSDARSNHMMHREEHLWDSPGPNRVAACGCENTLTYKTSTRSNPPSQLLFRMSKIPKCCAKSCGLAGGGCRKGSSGSFVPANFLVKANIAHMPIACSVAGSKPPDLENGWRGSTKPTVSAFWTLDHSPLASKRLNRGSRAIPKLWVS